MKQNFIYMLAFLTSAGAKAGSPASASATERYCENRFEAFLVKYCQVTEVNWMRSDGFALVMADQAKDPYATPKEFKAVNDNLWKPFEWTQYLCNTSAPSSSPGTPSSVPRSITVHNTCLLKEQTLGVKVTSLKDALLKIGRASIASKVKNQALQLAKLAESLERDPKLQKYFSGQNWASSVINQKAKELDSYKVHEDMEMRH